eukprot:gene8702-17983_t
MAQPKIKYRNSNIQELADSSSTISVKGPSTILGSNTFPRNHSSQEISPFDQIHNHSVTTTGLSLRLLEESFKKSMKQSASAGQFLSNGYTFDSGPRVAEKRYKFMTLGPINRPRDDSLTPFVPQIDEEDFNGNFTALVSPIMEKGDLIISVEHCCDCSCHDISLRHNEMKYLDLANKTLQILTKTIHLHKLSLRVGVLLIPIITEKRLGAFEVSIRYRTHDDNDIKFENIYSKLDTLQWPKFNILRNRLKQFLYKVNIPTYVRKISSYSSMNQIEGLEAYPVGFGNWKETKLSDPSWRFDNKDRYNLFIQWVYDSRADVTGPIFHKVLINPNSNPPNEHLISTKIKEMINIQNLKRKQSFKCALNEVYAFEINKDDIDRIDGKLKILIKKRENCTLSAILTTSEKPSAVVLIEAVAVPSESTIGAIVKFRIIIHPEHSLEMYNPSTYARWSSLFATYSGEVFSTFDIIIKPINDILIPKSYNFYEKCTESSSPSTTTPSTSPTITTNTSNKNTDTTTADSDSVHLPVPIYNLRCVFRHTNGDEESSTSDENGHVIIPSLATEGRWTLHTSSKRCNKFYETYITDMMVLHRLAVDSLDKVDIELHVYNHFQVKNITFDRLKITSTTSAPLSSTTSKHTHNASSSLAPEPLPLPFLSSLTTTTTTHTVQLPPIGQYITCTIDECYSLILNENHLKMLEGIVTTSPPHVEVSHLSATLTKDGKISSGLVVDAIIIPYDNATDGTSTSSSTAFSASSSASVAMIKFRIRVCHTSNTKDSFIPANFVCWSMLLGSTTGEVFMRFDVTLLPNASLLAPKSYTFLDEADNGKGISGIKCVFRHAVGTSTSTAVTVTVTGVVEGERTAISDDNGVVIVPDLHPEGKWTMTTYSKNCNVSFFETYTKDFLRLGPQSDGGLDNVTVSLHRAFASPSEGYIITTNGHSPDIQQYPLATEKVSPLDVGCIKCSLDTVYSFDLTGEQMSTIGGVFKNSIEKRIPCSLSGAIINHDDSISNILVVEALATPLSWGVGALVKFVIKVHPNFQHVAFDLTTYSEWRVVLGSISGVIFSKFDVVLTPSMAVLPPRSYCFTEDKSNVSKTGSGSVSGATSGSGIAKLQCIFRHDHCDDIIAISDDNGVVIVPDLHPEGKWTMTTY